MFGVGTQRREEGPHGRLARETDRSTVAPGRAMSDTTIDAPPAPRKPERSTARRSLFNPWVDFLTLGGGSLVVLAAVAAFMPRDEETRAVLAATMLFVAHFVNHPHFAHSYQLFYRGFLHKAFSPASTLRHRYLTAGIVVPVAIVSFFGIALARADAAMLGLAANVMFFTVGWHYAKQGFGVLMVDAAHKAVRFTTAERRHLLWNVHLAWVNVWLLANNELAMKKYWGLSYIVFDVPDPLLAAATAAVVVSTFVVCRDLVARWLRERALPVNGLIGYACGVYIWLMVSRFDPLLLLVVPVFHSLQYMVVVWRYQLNAERRPGGRSRRGGTSLAALMGTYPARLARFALLAGVLGVVGFWWGPQLLDAVVDYDRASFGTTAFLFMAWTFINIHHYFIDNVIWRRDNADMREHLFRPLRE